MTAPKTPKPGVLYLYRLPKQRVKLATRADLAALEKMRDAVAFLQDHGAPASLEQEATIALEAHVAGLAARYNGGQPFPARPGELAPGRRTGVHGRHAGRQLAMPGAVVVDEDE